MAAGTEPGALSLRAISRELGVSPAALYSYFEDKDALITALVAGSFDSLTAALAESSTVENPRERLMEMAVRYRAWALASRVDFRMLFGTPVPGYKAPSQGPTFQAVSRFGALVLDAVRAASTGALVEDGSADASTETAIDEFFVRYLGRLHGLVSLEIAGYLQVVMPDISEVYRREVVSLIGELDRPSGSD